MLEDSKLAVVLAVAPLRLPLQIASLELADGGITVEVNQIVYMGHRAAYMSMHECIDKMFTFQVCSRSRII